VKGYRFFGAVDCQQSLFPCLLLVIANRNRVSKQQLLVLLLLEAVKANNKPPRSKLTYPSREVNEFGFIAVELLFIIYARICVSRKRRAVRDSSSFMEIFSSACAAAS